jgi:hypothetical protein
MGLGKIILDVIGGKEPDIFDEKGNVIHKLPKKKWDAWNNRSKTDPQNNWRNHTGVTGAKKTAK